MKKILIFTATALILILLLISFNYKFKQKNSLDTVVYNYDNNFNDNPERRRYFDEFKMEIIDMSKEYIETPSNLDKINISSSYYIEDENNIKLVNYASRNKYKYKLSYDRSIYELNDNEAWKLISNGMIDKYPTKSFIELENIIKEIYKENSTIVEVPVWVWRYPKNIYNMSKKKHILRICVNKNISHLFVNAFTKIFNDPSKPVFNINDTDWGTWVMRGKLHNPHYTPSAHSYGTTIDINPSTGTFKVNGVLYGNDFGNKPMTENIWRNLPETHNKYHVIYVDCPIVKAFKSEGFYWGGDWGVGTDCMHFGWLGDICGREEGIKNYYNYKE